jgi:hypothetical protein
MKPVIFTILCCLLLSGAVSANVIFTLPRTDYYVPLGGSAEIRIFVENTGDDIPGTITRFENRTSIGPDGLPSSVRKKESSLYLVRSGNSSIDVSTGTSDVTATSVLSFLYEYSDPEPRVIALDGPVIHFVSEVSSSPQESEPLRSRETSPVQAGLSNPADGSGGQGTQETRSGTGEQAPIVRSMADDAGSLDTYVSEVNEQYEQNRRSLEQILDADPLFSESHRFLVEKGYRLESRIILPTSNETGTFRCEYISNVRFPVEVSGGISGGRVNQLLAAGRGSELVPEVLAHNSSYQDYTGILVSEGLECNSTSISAVPDTKTVGVLYSGISENSASVTAVIVNGTIQSVTLDRQVNDEASIALIGILIMILVVVSGGLVLFKRKEATGDDSGKEEIETAPVVEGERGDGAQMILGRAMDACSRGDIRQAYEYAGRALRFHVSLRYGTGMEITGEEAIRLLPDNKAESEMIKSIIRRCTLVAFACRPGTNEDFLNIVRQIDDLLGSADDSGPIRCDGEDDDFE